MADARSLLRAQRTARRITHPHAQYTDAGKLACSLCREPIRSDVQWEGHTRSVGHRQRLLAHQKPRAAEPSTTTGTNGTSASGGVGGKSKSTDTLSDEALLAQIIAGGTPATAVAAGHKRKHASEDDDDDVDMADAAPADEDAARAKRSRPDTEPDADTVPFPTLDSHTTSASNESLAKRHSPTDASSKRTPPSLARRISGTPSHGVELQIPSRPATPGAASATSTPKATPMVGRSPLIPEEAQMGVVPGAGTGKPTARAAFAAPATTGGTQNTDTTAPAGNDDDDWAAFEAEVVHAAPAPPAPAGTVAPSDAVISAAPLTAEQLAAKSAEEEREKRRMLADVEIEDEREEATRALETEFEEMEELEARVRRLKEKREAIRRGSVTGPGASAAEQGVKEKLQPLNGTVVDLPQGNGEKGEDGEEEDEEEEEEEDEDDDDWAGFRFRA